jgi:ATP-dependent RNA circularization protein (DNA/RNA ligase family)
MGAPVAAWTGYNGIIFKHNNMVVATKYVTEYISLINLALESLSKTPIHIF